MTFVMNTIWPCLRFVFCYYGYFFIQGFHPHCAIKNETSVLLIMNAEIKLQHHILDVDILGNITELPCYSYTFSL